MNPEDLHAGAKMDLHTGAKMDLHKGVKIHGYREGGFQCICTASNVFLLCMRIYAFTFLLRRGFFLFVCSAGICLSNEPDNVLGYFVLSKCVFSMGVELPMKNKNMQNHN